MTKQLEGRVAIVTGAARGIGHGIVTCLVESGAKVLFTDVNSQRGSEAEAGFLKNGYDVKFLLADTSVASEVDTMVQTAIDAFGHIDILCPNAGIFPETSIEDTSEEEWDHVCAVNLKGPFLAAKACLPHMKAQRFGRIVITSSITGPVVSSPGHGHYAATKSGVLGFMRTAALEWAPWDITINAVEPGNILTEGMKAHRDQAFIDAQEASVPLGRLGKPSDIGKAVRFLASDDAAYITGQTLIVDGGQTLPEMNTAILPRLD